jgi:outer membrane protein assembly factor BamB
VASALLALSVLSVLLSAPAPAAPGAVRLEAAWTAPLPPAFNGSPGSWLLATDRSVYVAGLELDAATGRARRTLLRPLYQRGELLREAPSELEQVAADGGRVFLLARFWYGGDLDPMDLARSRQLANDRALVVVDERTGRQRWRLDAQLGSPLAVGEGIALVLRDDRPTALEASTGAVRWRAPEGSSEGAEGAAIAGGVVALEGSRAAPGSSVRGLAVADGRLLWETPLGGTAYAEPAAGRELFFTTRESCTGVDPERCDATVHALDRAGEVRWQRAIPGERPMFRAPAIHDGRVVVVTDVAVHALSERTGEELWRRAVVADSVTIDSRPTFAGPLVLLWAGDAVEHDRHGVSETWRVLALDAATGALRWSFASRRPVSQLSRPFRIGQGGDLVYADGGAVRRMRKASPPAPR